MIVPLFDMLIAAIFIILCEIPKYAQAKNTILFPLTGWPTLIVIIWKSASITKKKKKKKKKKKASMLTKLDGDDECSLKFIIF